MTRIQLVIDEQDLSNVLEPKRRMQVDAFAARMCQTAFDLAVPPHFRVALLRLAAEEHLLVNVFHHAIIDGSSMGRSSVNSQASTTRADSVGLLYCRILRSNTANCRSRHGATLFMGLLSAFQLLLQRWADTDDVIIGAPVSGSRDEDLAPLIGCFVNTLALRGDLSGDPNFSALLAQNRSSLLAAFEHQQVAELSA
jgi:hypothetical protein